MEAHINPPMWTYLRIITVKFMLSYSNKMTIYNLIPVAHADSRSQSAVLQRYIYTSSAKKRKRQDVHCHFCGAEVENRHLENHLVTHDNCIFFFSYHIAMI